MQHKIQIEAHSFAEGFEFIPAVSFASGQTFRWQPVDALGLRWVGVAGNLAMEVERSEIRILGKAPSSDSPSAEEFVHRYFSLGDDVARIIQTFPKDDKLLNEAISSSRGLRIFTQEPWECLISFVCSQVSNIPSISTMISNLSRKFGERIISYGGTPLYSFPTPASLAKASEKELMACKLGFRAKYVKHIAQNVDSGILDLEKMRLSTLNEARSKLISGLSHLTLGVGPKIADCVTLFSFHQLGAFPIDTWISKCIRNFYAKGKRPLKTRGNPSLSKYDRLAELMRMRFGPNAGYAQQYLYVYSRRHLTTKKLRRHVSETVLSLQE
jgi:N-glycosylase/DNA lyase